MSTEIQSKITIIEDTSGWVAKDEATGVASQGITAQAALSNLQEAVSAYKGAGRSPTPSELVEIGIDPENNVPGSRLPDAFE